MDNTRGERKDERGGSSHLPSFLNRKAQGRRPGQSIRPSHLSAILRRCQKLGQIKGHFVKEDSQMVQTQTGWSSVRMRELQSQTYSHLFKQPEDWKPMLVNLWQGGNGNSCGLYEKLNWFHNKLKTEGPEREYIQGVSTCLASVDSSSIPSMVYNPLSTTTGYVPRSPTKQTNPPNGNSWSSIITTRHLSRGNENINSKWQFVTFIFRVALITMAKTEIKLHKETVLCILCLFQWCTGSSGGNVEGTWSGYVQWIKSGSERQ